MIIPQALTALIIAFLFLPDGPPWPTFSVDPLIHNIQDVDYNPKKDTGHYLSQKILYRPVRELRHELESFLDQELKHRGEAHITVITPPEYRDILSEFMTMEEIRHLAHAFNLQSSPFHIACLGRGTYAELETYFLLVESPRLLQFRQKIQTIYEQRGGVVGGFVAEHYFPHITIGFTQRDLHESDGVRKDPRTCWARVVLKP